MAGGRPPIFDNVDDMLPLLGAWEKLIEEGESPTITGLALALGFADKSTLYEYAKKDGFSYPIKKAILIVENGYEKALKQGNAAGSIFALKNFNWKDKQEIEHSGTIKRVQIEGFGEQLPPDEENDE